MARAASNGRVLSNADASLVKGMIARGDRQHDIAAYFAVNGGRIGETSTGEHFAAVAAATSGLPPAAPYLVVPSSLRVVADALYADLKALGAPKATTDRLDQLIGGMEASRLARRGK